jgi:cytochrome P450
MERAAASIVSLFGGNEVSDITDPYRVYARLRRDEPAILVETMAGNGAYFFTRYRDVYAILRDDHLFSNRANDRGISLIMGRTIVAMDGDEHLRHRKLVSAAFAPRSLDAEFKAGAAATANALIDGFAARGRAELVEEFTFTFPIRVLCDILALPVEDYAAFHRWAIDLTMVARDPARGLAASQAMAEYLLPFIRQRRAAPSDDLISSLAHAEVDGHRLTDEEVTSFLRLLVLAGAETTYHLIGSTLVALLKDRELLARVYADRKLLEPVMNEAVRWESPIQMVSRETVEPVTVAGVELPAGADLLLSIGSANRDDSEFEEPDRFDIERKRGEHIAFGFGRHFCVGARLAKTEFNVAMNALLDRLPNLELEPGEDCRVVGLAFRGPDRLPVRFGRAS